MERKTEDPGPAPMLDRMTWLNPPPEWSVSGDRLTMVTGERTDFWQGTFYGFRRDDGHFLHRTEAGDFSAEATVQADWSALYDQAGLMVRQDAETWVKTGIEFTDGAMHFSCVVTRGGWSDWSVLPLGDWARPALSVRVTRHGPDIRVQYRDEAGAWQLARLAHLGAEGPVAVGPMACTPERGGLSVTFSGVKVGPAISRELH